MNIEEQFNLIANEYDANRKKFIPCFEDYYDNTTKFIVSNLKEPKKVLDLGAGTGLLSYYWYNYFPKTEYVLVDVAEDMLNVAKKRFNGISTITYQVLDYTKALPKDNFDIIMSALSVHHLEQEDKIKLFANIYDKLPDGGIFVNYDQFCAGQSNMNVWFDTYWENHLMNSGLSSHDISLWKERRKLDRECSIEQEIEMLNNCKFKAV
ncbi:MAG: class I SAM-dependent methyltransferase [Clostridia bacterium]|nr:class I SAM-dependent methyltransferase [Clostridia bacterium]